MEVLKGQEYLDSLNVEIQDSKEYFNNKKLQLMEMINIDRESLKEAFTKDNYNKIFTLSKSIIDTKKSYYELDCKEEEDLKFVNFKKSFYERGYNDAITNKSFAKLQNQVQKEKVE